MKNPVRVVALALAIAIGGVALASVLSAAEELATGIEHLDSELHAIRAPDHVINLVHHSEETVFEFVDAVSGDAPYPSLYAEFQHIKRDVVEIRREMIAHRYFNNMRVRGEMWHVWTASRYLDHEFYHPTGPGGSRGPIGPGPRH